MQWNSFQLRRTTSLLGTLALTLAGCGGGSAQYASVGGSVSGLKFDIIIVQNNQADDLVLQRDQPFVFPKPVSNGDAYNVSIKRQPLGQSCAVENGSGVVNNQGDAVSNVGIRCTMTASVIGFVMGLPGWSELVLGFNGVPISITGGSFFAFPGLLPSGSAFSVTIITQPVGQTCNIYNANGVASPERLAQVTVSCPRPDGGPVRID